MRSFGGQSLRTELVLWLPAFLTTGRAGQGRRGCSACTEQVQRELELERLFRKA